jgi:hypothetical protein
MRRVLLSHIGYKEKCAAKPEGHRVATHFSLCSPLYLESRSQNVAQKVQRMTWS